MPQDRPERYERRRSNLDEPDPRTNMVGPSREDVHRSHQRLFGPNAKMSSEQRIGRAKVPPVGARSADTQAMLERPRATNYGQDIRLPVEKKRTVTRKISR